VILKIVLKAGDECILEKRKAKGKLKQKFDAALENFLESVNVFNEARKNLTIIFS
jgi:hypothetical protein